MSYFDLIDFSWTQDGDLQLDADGDLAYVEDDEYAGQELKFRVKTDSGDYLLYPMYGSSVVKLIVGQPNNEAIADLAEQLIVNALTYDQFIFTADLSVRAVPVGNDLFFYISILDGNEEVFLSSIQIDGSTGEVS